MSATDITRILQREEGNSLSDETVYQLVCEAYAELESRSLHCGESGSRYPYELGDQGTLLQYQPSGLSDEVLANTYLYLVLATRMNMQTDRCQGGEDGTALFEELCREIALRYWGGGPEAEEDNVNAIVFGTGRQTQDLEDDVELDVSSFGGKVNHLCSVLHEGADYLPKGKAKPKAKDGKLDIVVWHSFADGRCGQLIGFGQCKTGTHWQNDLAKLRPLGFCQKWMRVMPAVLPVRLYFVTERVISDWYERCADGGILFDRCRIMEFARGIPLPLSNRLKKWVQAAAGAEGLSLS